MKDDAWAKWLTESLASVMWLPAGSNNNGCQVSSNYYYYHRCYDCLGQTLAQRGQVQARAFSLLVELQEAGDLL